MPAFNDDINQRDLSEAPRLEKDKQSFGGVVGIAIAVLLFGVLLILGSQPELTPEEIISMDGYEGEQPTRHIFNLQDMEEPETPASVQASEPASNTSDQAVATVEAPVATVAKAPVENATVQEPPQTTELAVIKSATVDTESTAPKPATVDTEVVELPVAVTEPVPVAPTEAPVAVTEPVPVAPTEAPVAVTEPVPVAPTEAPVAVTESVPVTPTEEVPVAVTESVPVAPTEAPVAITEPVARTESVRPSLFENTEEERVVAAMATTPKLEEQPDTIVISTAVVDELAPMPIRSPSAGERVLLPLRTILNESTELKAEPDEESDTLILLGEGVVVSAFERRGEWIFVGTNDGSATTGYVLEDWLVDEGQ